MRSFRPAVALLALPFALGAASCASKRQPAPEPQAEAAPAAAPARPTSAPTAAAPDWQDAPLTPGTWRYEAGRAEFAGGGAVFAMRCDLAAGRVLLERPGTGATRLDITTSSGARSFAAADGAAATFARDPFLDAIAFSRGRFAVAAAGQPTLIVPAWAEPARVIEDCRAA